uniref:Uncharacterized protein n=1 Tax=Oryza meridionalis TaxID=40149 RepID=A0A0E0C748_9ORYZ
MEISPTSAGSRRGHPPYPPTQHTPELARAAVNQSMTSVSSRFPLSELAEQICRLESGEHKEEEAAADADAN